jgi:hypothetical protein
MNASEVIELPHDKRFFQKGCLKYLTSLLSFRALISVLSLGLIFAYWVYQRFEPEEMAWADWIGFLSLMGLILVFVTILSFGKGYADEVKRTGTVFVEGCDDGVKVFIKGASSRTTGTPLFQSAAPPAIASPA